MESILGNSFKRYVSAALVLSLFSASIPSVSFAAGNGPDETGIEVVSESSAPPIELRNIETMEQADNYGKWIVSKYAGLKETAEAGSPVASLVKEIPAIHIGDPHSLPPQLKWVLSYLSRAGYRPKIEIIDREELDQEIEAQKKAGAVALDQLSYREEMKAPEAQEFLSEAKEQTKSFMDKVRFRRDRFFGAAGSMTIWPTIKRSKEEKIREGKTALFQSALGGASVAFSVYLKGGANSHYLAAAVGMAGWISLNMYFARHISAIQGQGRIVYEKKPGQWVVESAPRVSRFVGFLRAMVTNYIFLTLAFGPGKVTQLASFMVAFGNSFATLFSRFWYDELMSKRSGTPMPDGSIVYNVGDFTPKQQNLYRNIFEFTNGFFKNLNLVGIPYVQYVFPLSGAVGLFFTMRSKWTHHMNGLKKVPRFMTWLVDNLKGSDVPFESFEKCETLLVLPAAKPKADSGNPVQ